jgi:hypothetical protein
MCKQLESIEAVTQATHELDRALGRLVSHHKERSQKQFMDTASAVPARQQLRTAYLTPIATPTDMLDLTRQIK